MKNSPTYFRDGKLLVKNGDIRVYELNSELFMELGRQNLISSERDLSEYIWQMSDRPFGNCLLIGLGLGVASKYLLSFDNVKSVTVIEEYETIIEAQNELSPINDKRFSIINEPALSHLYETDNSMILYF